MKKSNSLKRLMKSKNISSEELSTMSGVNQISIDNYLGGKSEIRYKTAIKLADALDVSISEISKYTDISYGKIVADKLIEVNMPTSKLADLVDVGYSYLKSFIRGERNILTIKALVGIADILEIDVFDIMNLKDVIDAEGEDYVMCLLIGHTMSKNHKEIFEEIKSNILEGGEN